MKATIRLYCEGRVDNNFIFCNGVENDIVNLNDYITKQYYLEMIEYLDKAVQLFDSPCCNINIIGSVMYRLYNWGCIGEDKYKRIIDFCNFHNRCGIILYAIPNKI